MKSLIIIPARYNSSRFPGKPLADINGKTMIERVYSACLQSSADDVVVATENEEIYNEVTRYGKAVYTSADCQTGTERVIEAFENISGNDYDIIVNIQGDEPFILPEDIDSLISNANQYGDISTLVTSLNESESTDRNVVKCISDYTNACMFTRSPLYRPSKIVYKHIGTYAFRRESLEKIKSLNLKTTNEVAESLEQLRWLDNGININIRYTPNSSISIDTPEDLQKALELL
tara:strand:+ start:773 stop:1471 length:699 start_codon:yes stop_codon:yes gene_type:complete